MGFSLVLHNNLHSPRGCVDVIITRFVIITRLVGISWHCSAHLAHLTMKEALYKWNTLYCYFLRQEESTW